MIIATLLAMQVAGCAPDGPPAEKPNGEPDIVRGFNISVPGGNIYVNEPLLKLAKNRDELAGVLAHEAGHMVKHHVANRIANAGRVGTGASVVSVLSQIVLGPLAGAGIDYAIGQGAASQDASLSRHIEAEADEEGARIMAASNTFNPYGLIWFFQTMSATYGPGQNNYLRSHPLDAQRIADLQHQLVVVLKTELKNALHRTHGTGPIAHEYAVGFLVPHMVAAHYFFAGKAFHQWLPSWFGPSDPAVVRGFFLGGNGHVPWAAWLLPGVLTRRHATADPTAAMVDAPTPNGAIRLGPAHGSLACSGADDSSRHNLIAADRPQRAGLAYLALGDWHGAQEIGGRCWYSGTPETDDFGNGGGGGGEALVVDVAGSNDIPVVVRYRIGRFAWVRIEAALHNATEGFGVAAPLIGRYVPSWAQIGLAGLIA